MYIFQTEIENLYNSNNFPIITICLSNTRDVHVDLKKMFLAHFNISAPLEQDRVKMLSWLLKYKNITTNNLDVVAVASKCHGFYFEDLETLVFHAKKLWFREYNDSSSRPEISEHHFMKALGKKHHVNTYSS